jgi:serpin B
MELVESDVARAPAPDDARDAAVRAVTAFTADVYGLLARGATGNLVCSPYSVAVALGMCLQGARGGTATEILDVLHATDAAALAAGLNGIDAALASRPGPDPTPDRGVVLDGANSLWGQRGVAWRPEFLDVLAREFGTGMRVVDYLTDPEGARRQMNAWVAERTRDRIPELVPPGAITPDSRLTLVNALYLKASWQTPFVPDLTTAEPFHRLDGSTSTADLMHAGYGGASVGYARGDGWTAVDLPYTYGEVALAVVVPDDGRFADVERAIAAWLPQVLGGLDTFPVALALPRWTSRTQVDLVPALAGLGMPGALGPGADFGGMTGEERVFIGAAVHEGYIAVDEAGTEAAAATAIVMRVMGLPSPPERSLVVDRPFLFVLHDRPTGTPLFVGRVLDPADAPPA